MGNTLDEEKRLCTVLACPQCGGDLAIDVAGATCQRCGVHFDRPSSSALDLRLKIPKTCCLQVNLDPFSAPRLDIGTVSSLPNPSPDLDISNLAVPFHLTRDLLSYFPKAKGSDKLALDLGCGSGLHREMCERAGFEFIGLDYESSSGAVVIGDAHALPFKDDSLDFVLSVAVLEHVRYPLVVMREVSRVLKPGSRFVGTVAFLEPFHSDSYHHNTHLGVLNLLAFGGFEVEYLAPEPDWTVLTAQACMALFPKMPSSLAKSLVWPLATVHRLWWAVGRIFNPKASEAIRLLMTSGSFQFAARKV